MRPVLLALVLLYPASRICQASEPTLEGVPAWTGPVENTKSIALGDIDRDGDLDLVRGNVRQPTTLYLNLGGTLAEVPAWRGREEGTRTIALGDVDGDGDLDLVRGNYDRGATLYLNTGGTFESDTAWTSSPENTYYVALADVDGDGDLDLIRGNVGDSTSLCYNTGGRFERTSVRIGPAGNTYGLAVGDVDGDGDLDLVRGNYAQSVTLYLNSGGGFATTPIPIGRAENTNSVALGDVDGDGDLDLVRGNFYRGSTLYLNIGGTFASDPAWTGQVEGTVGVALGDLDGDGDLDLVLGNESQEATLYLNSVGTFESVPAWRGPTENTTSIAIGDLDGDGDLDLVRGNSGQAATVYSNLSGAFTPAPSWRAPAANTHSVILGDIDSDGAPDLIRGNAGQPATLHLNRGGVLIPEPWPAPIENTYCMALGDVDHDNRLDVLLGNVTEQPPSLYLNTGGGFAPTPIRTGPAQKTFSVALGDVDGDGWIDLVRGNQDQPATLHLNRAGRLDSASAWTGPLEDTRGIALGDIDGDGDLDLVRGNFDQAATLRLNNGRIFESGAAWTGPVESTTSVAFGDIDGDGDLDLVRGNSGQATLYMNTGGAFAPQPAWGGLSEATHGIALGDVDGDGDLDLVRGNFGQASTLYLNIGGTFGLAPAWAGQLEGTQSVALGDVNGDGALDLLLGNDSVNNVPFETTLYLHRSPWVGAPGDNAPKRHLPDNPAHLRWVHATPSGSNGYTIHFSAFDAEADLLWLVGEYQLEGTGGWHPMTLAGTELRTGPFATSPAGIAHEVSWDVSSLPFDRRNVVVRLRAVSPPRRAGVVQFVPSYVVNVGPVVPFRPQLAVETKAFDFGTVTQGDTATAALQVENTGSDTLIVNEIALPSVEMGVDVATGVVLRPGESRSITVSLRPVRGTNVSGAVTVRSNDPINPEVSIPVTARILPLAVTTQLVEPPSGIRLGQALSVIVIPKNGARIEEGTLHVLVPGREGGSFPLDSLGQNFSSVIPGNLVTEAGLAYYIELRNHPASATDPPGAPDSSYHVTVPRPSILTTAPQPNSGDDQFLSGLDVRVILGLEAGASFQWGTLHYRRGGESAYDSVLVADDGGILSGVIPGFAAGLSGLEYWVEVTTLDTTLRSPPPGARPQTIQVTVPEIEEGASFPGRAYRMVSLPLDFGPAFTGTLGTLLGGDPVFGSYEQTRWRCFRYVNQYLELSDTTHAEQFYVRPARAFWLIAREPNRMHVTFPGLSISTAADFQLTLTEGWNQIANPFAFPVHWSSRQVTPEDSLDPPQRYDPVAGRYDTVDVLQPFEGYFVWNDGPDGTVLSIPPVRTDPPLAPPPAPLVASAVTEDSWRVRVIASCAGVVDGEKVAGVASGALTERDPWDRRAPPPSPGPALYLYFLEPDASRGSRQLSVDILPPLEAVGEVDVGRVWSFDMLKTFAQQGPTDEVALRFAGIEEVPAALSARLIDRALGIATDLRDQAEYRFFLGEKGPVTNPDLARFELRVGSEAFVRRGPRPPPERNRLLQNFPNPVRTGTVIRCDLAEPGEVTVRIFDIGGRLVRTLRTTAKEPGRYELAWHGEDEQGRRVASGLYQYRLERGSYFESRKMLVVR